MCVYRNERIIHLKDKDLQIHNRCSKFHKLGIFFCFWKIAIKTTMNHLQTKEICKITLYIYNSFDVVYLMLKHSKNKLKNTWYRCERDKAKNKLHLIHSEYIKKSRIRIMLPTIDH